MKRFYSIYQYVVPIIFFPVGYYLWLRQFSGDHSLVILTLSLPVIWGYVIPGIGTNLLRLWGFNTCFRIGRYRPHHGIVFGTAVSLIALLCNNAISQDTNFMSIASSAFVFGSVYAFWNWLYDMYAIKSGFITLHKPEHYKDVNVEMIVTEYAPIIFGFFGICYGVFLHLMQYYLIGQSRSDLYWSFLIWGNISVLIIPVLAFGIFTYFKYGIGGIKSLLKGGVL
jgi:hypothetical protein